MKRIGILTALWLVASVSGVKAQAEDRAKALVQKALERIYSCEVAPVWESFSEPSKDELRKAFLDSLSADRETWKPGKEATASPFALSFLSDEDRRKVEADRSTPFWEQILKRKGFQPDLDSVKALGNHDFWETFLSEQYLKDKEYHAPVAPLSAWPKGKSRVPSYQVEGVAVSGDRFYVIMMAPHELQRVLFLLFNGSSSVSWAEPDGLPDERFVWSGRITGGRFQLDVPESVVRLYRMNAFATRHPRK